MKLQMKQMKFLLYLKNIHIKKKKFKKIILQKMKIFIEIENINMVQ